MSQSDHQMSCALRALDAVYDLVDAIAAEDARAHNACMAARSCIHLAACIAGIHVTGVTDDAEHARAASMYLATARAR